MAKFEQGYLIVENGLGYEELIVSGTSIGLAEVPENQRTRRIVIQTGDQPVRWLAFPGCDPTAFYGLKLLAEDILVYDGEPDDIRFIADSTATGDAPLRVHYFGL